jgi:hypothetical protein
MDFDLAGIQATALDCGWSSELIDTAVHIALPGLGTLLFANDGDDTYIGFANAMWHSHGDIQAAMYDEPIGAIPGLILYGLYDGDWIVQRISYPNGLVDLQIHQMSSAEATPLPDDEQQTTIFRLTAGVLSQES